MKEQQENNTGNLSQITFKLSVEERQIIDEMVESSGLNLSEYCRIKCLMEANTLISQRKRIAELEYEIKTLKVKLSCNNNSGVGKYDILLELTEQQRNLFERLYGDFSHIYILENMKNSVTDDLNFNILYTLFCLPQLDDLTFENKDFNYWTPVIEEVFSELVCNTED